MQATTFPLLRQLARRQCQRLELSTFAIVDHIPPPVVTMCLLFILLFSEGTSPECHQNVNERLGIAINCRQFARSQWVAISARAHLPLAPSPVAVR